MSNFKSAMKPVLSWEFFASFCSSVVVLIAIYKIDASKDLLSVARLLLLFLSIYLIRFVKNEKAALGILTGVASILIAYYGSKIWLSLFEITEWDFLCYYLNGKACAEGLSLYDPVSFAQVMNSVSLPFPLSDSFYHQAVATGVLFPPTTMLLVAPLGYMDVYTANVIWRILVLGFLIIDMALIYKLFRIDKSKWLQLLIIFVLTMTFPGTGSTLGYAQTNFFLLFFILLVYQDPSDWKAGVYMAIAVIFKPISVVWALIFLINKKWKPVLSFAVSSLVIIAATILLIGIENFMMYFTSPPIQRIPAGSYIEDINKSMNAVFTRASMYTGMNLTKVAINWAVFSASLILLVVTCLASIKLKRVNEKASFLILLPFSRGNP
jgi:hypothetical protein